MTDLNPDIRVRYNYRLRLYREGKITDHKLIQANEDIGDLLDELEAYIPVEALIDKLRYSTDHDSSNRRIHELLELFDADSGNLKGHDNE